VTTARVGISGWNYRVWRGAFYPKGLRQADELRFASRRFSSIELNGSFYSLQRPASYQRWYAETPERFVFAIKGGRFITHMKRLRNVESALANFFASGLLELKEKLGPILWQLPPRFVYDEARLSAFFELLPRTTRQAAALAKHHDAWLSDRVAVKARHDAPLRYALEVRHPSFLTPSYVELLRRYSIASCVADTAGLYPEIDVESADFAYVRLHGSKVLYVSGYSEKELRRWAARIQDYRATGRDVYVYFDNDVKVRAPFDAENLERLLIGARPKRLPKVLSSVVAEPLRGWEAWRRQGESE
jgi:uncharacterized protein YecE (DUF72 family)